MLARYLRQQPSRYSIHTPEFLASVPFGTRVGALVHGLPSAAQDATPQLHEHLGGHLPAAQDLLHHLLHTGHPDHLNILLDLLHGEHDVPGPSPGGLMRRGPLTHTSLPPLARMTNVLHWLHQQQGQAAGDPFHWMRVFTPGYLGAEAHEYNLLQPALDHRQELVRALHPYHGGPGAAGIPDAILQAGSQHPAYNSLWDMLFQLYLDAGRGSHRS